MSIRLFLTLSALLIIVRPSYAGYGLDCPGLSGYGDPTTGYSVCMVNCGALNPHWGLKFLCVGYEIYVCNDHCSGGNSEPQQCAGNPIDIKTGAKLQTVQDYEAEGAFGLAISRSYNSNATHVDGMFGKRWSGLEYAKIVLKYINNQFYVHVYRSTGHVTYFKYNDTTTVFSPVSVGEDSSLKLIDFGEGNLFWEFRTDDDMTEYYVYDPVIDSVTHISSTWTLNGVRQIKFYYDALNRLEILRDQDNNDMVLTYNADDRIQTITVPGSRVYNYEYDALGNLEFVTYPDDTPADQTDNPQVQYHYEDPQIDSTTLERLYPYALTGITDENGDRFATWTYDTGGKGASSEHAVGVERVTFEYDIDQTTVTNANGRQTIYHFDILGDRESESGVKRVSSVEGVATSNCLASDTSYTYDSFTGFKNKETDSEGNITTFVMNSLGMETSRTEAQIDVGGAVVATADTRTIETDWDAYWRLPSEIREPGKTTVYTYENNRIKTKTETDTTSSAIPYSTNGVTRTWTYNYTYFGAGQQQVETISVDGPRTDVSDVSVQTFNPRGWLLQSQNALGHTAQILTHNTEGLPLTLQDPNGTQVSLTYTPRNWLDTRTEHSSDGDLVVDYDYDDVGQVTRVTLPNGVEVNYVYDVAHRLIEIYNTDEGGFKFERIEYVLDDLGNIETESIFYSSNTLVYQQQKIFDDLGRLLTVIGAEGQDLQANSYGPNGNLERVTDPNTVDIVHSFDGLNRLQQTEDRNGNAIVYEYDAQDHLISVTDQRLLITGYVYDGLGRKIQQSSPDTGVTIYYYDLADNLIQTIDARLVQVDYTYDALNRLLTTVYPATSSENLTYRYDELTIQGKPNESLGRLTGIDQDNGNSLEYLYDDRGNTIKTFENVNGHSFVTGYAYDEASLLEQVRYPSGRLVNYAYDNLGKVDSVTTQASSGEASETLASAINHNAFGPISQLTFGNGVQMDRSYDLHYRPDIVTAKDGGTDLMAYDYAFSARNYIDSITDLVNVNEG
ncbi:MAG: RHS repeat protein, partial [Pseudomonadales bacterium]|nr:RHS repeat protein [Pseudomonadales bacterium]